MEELLAAGHRVRVYDNLSSGSLENIAPFRNRVEFIHGDVRNLDDLDCAARGVDCIFHEAALVSVVDSIERPLENNAINVTGTLNVLLAARRAGVRRVLLAASAAAYGNSPELPKEETRNPDPESPYGVAKVAGEYYLRVFAGLYGVETVSLRYFNVYGPRQNPASMYSGVISRFVDAIRKGDPPMVFGDGRQTRDFVFVKDVVRANLLALGEHRIGAGEILNIGTGCETALRDILDALRTVTGRSFEVRFGPPRPGDIRRSVADIRRARSLLGYAPEYDIPRGLAELWASVNKADI